MNKKKSSMSLLALGLVFLLSACDGSQGVQEDAGLDDAGQDAVGGDEGAWEIAASALGERCYPWGEDAPDCTHALYDACGVTGPEIVCGRLEGNSREGICNLAGHGPQFCGA